MTAATDDRYEAVFGHTVVADGYGAGIYFSKNRSLRSG